MEEIQINISKKMNRKNEAIKEKTDQLINGIRWPPIAASLYSFVAVIMSNHCRFLYKYDIHAQKHNS